MELAELYIRYEQFDAALEQYNAIIDMAGGDTRQRAMAMKDVGDVLALMGRSDEAIESYRSAMRLVEEGYWLHRELQQGIINVYRSENRLVELLDELEADWSSPDFAQLMLLASLYEETGRDDRALETVERAVREQPSSVDARLALIRMLERRGESDRVVEEYETLIRRNPGDSTYRFRLVDVLRRSGDREAAIEVLAEIADRFSSDSSVLIEVADRYMRFRESEPAGVIYERLVRIDPDNPDNWIALGEYQFMESRRSEAERSWREILARISPEDEAHAELADVFANHGLVEEAIVELEEARAIAPENDGYLRTLA
jgi:tetratricopeptide (TPR) repeat protein